MKLFLLYFKSILDFYFLVILDKLFKPHHSKKNKNVLIINTGQIGDLIISGKLFENDQLLFEYTNVYFILRKDFMSLFSNYSGKINVLELKHNSYRYNYLYRFIYNYKISKLNIDEVYNITSVRSTWNDTLALGIGAAKKYCYENNWNSLVKYNLNKIERFYSGALCKGIFNEYNRIEAFLNLISKEKIPINNSVFYDNLSNISRYDIVIAPFSSDLFRDWEIENFNKVIQQFVNSYKILVLCSEQQVKFTKVFIDHKNLTIASGNLTFNEIFNAIKNAKIFLGLDSGITHLALKTKTKVIAIIGGGNFGRYLPKPADEENIYLSYKMDCFGCEWKCIKDKIYCVENVSYKNVNEHIDILLNKHENS